MLQFIDTHKHQKLIQQVVYIYDELSKYSYDYKKIYLYSYIIYEPEIYL